MERRRRGWGRVVVLALVAALLMPLVLLLGANFFLNLGVPYLLNGDPEKLEVRYTWAWMWRPGFVDVGGLQIRGQGRNDQWLLTLDRVRGVIDLDALRHREFRATEVRGTGGTFRFRFRADAPVDPALDTSPPIAGLTNPPDPVPDPTRSAKGPWRVSLVGADIEDVREVWLEAYRYVGSAHATGDLALADVMSADAELAIADGQVLRGDHTLADTVAGQVEVALSGLERGVPITMDALEALDARADLAAQAQDLAFLDFYLQRAPWLTLDGAAALDIDVTLEDGEFTTGSTLTAETSDLAVGLLGWEIRGDGEARLEVVDGAEGAASRLSVAYGAFSIRDGAEEPLAVGSGFHLTAVSPDTALVRPLTSLRVVVDVPESQIPDVRRFDRYLPQGVGLTITGGTGTLSGHLEASAEDASLTGVVEIEGDDVRATVDGLVITTDLALHANLGSGDIGAGVYDFSRSELKIDRLGIEEADPETGRREDASRSWWASIGVRQGVVRVGAPTYLDATIDLRSADSVPFVRAIAQRKALPGWVQGVLDVPDVEGTARVKLGNQSIAVSAFEVTGGMLEVQMRWLRESNQSSGALFARYGKLSVAVDFDPTGHETHLFDARDWFTGARDADGQEKQDRDDQPVRAHTRSRKDEARDG